MTFAIIARFEAKPGCVDELEQVLLDTSKYSLAEEAGCLRFEVLRPTDPEGNVLPDILATNELFVDMVAVEEHRNSPRTPVRIARIRELAHSTVIYHALTIDDA